jgi:hypothetical protein
LIKTPAGSPVNGLLVNAIMFEVERGTTMPPKYQPNDEPNPPEPVVEPKNEDSEATSEKAETASSK